VCVIHIGHTCDCIFLHAVYNYTYVTWCQDEALVHSCDRLASSVFLRSTNTRFSVQFRVTLNAMSSCWARSIYICARMIVRSLLPAERTTVLFSTLSLDFIAFLFFAVKVGCKMSNYNKTLTMHVAGLFVTRDRIKNKLYIFIIQLCRYLNGDQ